MALDCSKRIRFAPFNGAYVGHAQDMKAANLVPENNMWSAVYDFNDENKTRDNWSYLPAKNEDSTWCPLGPASNCCARSDIGCNPSSLQGGDISNSSVVEKCKVSFDSAVRFSSVSTRRTSTLDVLALKETSLFAGLHRDFCIMSDNIKDCGWLSKHTNNKCGIVDVRRKISRLTEFKSLVVSIFMIIYNILRLAFSGIVKYGHQCLKGRLKNIGSQRDKSNNSTLHRK